MEYSKRARSEEARILEPLLINFIDVNDCIPISKNKFKVGRARYNDKIISDTSISRRHCVFRCEGEDKCTIKDVSSTSTFVNGVAIRPGIEHKISLGDSIQFGPNGTFKYLFFLTEKDHCAKKPRIDEKISVTALERLITFIENQKRQRKYLDDEQETKEKEHIELKQQLDDLLTQQTVAKEDENLLKQITALKDKIEACKAQKRHLINFYSQLLHKQKNEWLQFEERLSEEQEELDNFDFDRLEEEMLETEMENQRIEMEEQMEKRREEDARWRQMIENTEKEKKDIQTQLLNETTLETKLKETEETLKKQEAKAETSQILSEYEIIDTIDLTSSPNIQNTSIKENFLGKVSGIMKEQLSCTICTELFVKPTTLSCSHTFCQSCLKTWNKKPKYCPVCREDIKSMTRSEVLETFIERMLENLFPEFNNRRKDIIQEREDAEKK